MHAAHRPLPDRLDDGTTPAMSSAQTVPDYLDHFGLNGAPFSPERLPFFAGGNRGATLDALLYVLSHDEGIIKLTGDAGSGKTTLLRLLSERLPDTVAHIYMAASPGLSDDGLLDALTAALGLDAAPGALPVVTRHLLHDALAERRSQGRTTVVLIDDAHQLTHDALEEIGLLSEHTVGGHKTAFFVLAGQSGLNATLARDDERKLKEHITHNFVLDTLTPAEAADYLDFRLRAVGHTGPALFAPTAAHLLGTAAHGSLRQLDQLADQALHAAHAAGHRIVGLDDVRSLTQGIELPTVAAPRKQGRRTFYGSIAALSAILLGAGGFLVFMPSTHESAAPHSAPAPKPASTPPVAAPKAEPEPTPLPVAQNTDTSTESLTRQRLDAGEAWLKRTQNSHWFIQITAMDADQTEQIEGFLQKLAPILPPEQTRAYLGKRSGTPRIGIIYGDFPNQAEALHELSNLPQELRDEQPYIRQVKKLR